MPAPMPPDPIAAAISAASQLDADGLNALRGWIDAHLAAVPDPVLSERETVVIKLLSRGYSNKEIASRLRLSVKSVEKYKSRAIEKLGIRTRVGLVQYAVQRGWLGTTDEGADPACRNRRAW